MDYLDTRTKILYCSKDCALMAGANKENLYPIGPNEFKAQYEKGVETGDHWGALCPTCENEYKSFSTV